MESQRERLLAAASQLVATRGYHATTITDVVALASVSSKDFYAHFTGTEDCLLAAFAAMREYLQSHLAATAAAEPHWPRQVISVLAAALQFFAAEPDLASLCLIAPLSATPRTAERFREAIGTCPAALAVGREHLPGGECLPASTEDFLIGGVVHLATRWVLAGQAERLPVLLPDLVEFVLGPYLGVERAANLAADAAHI